MTSIKCYSNARPEEEENMELVTEVRRNIYIMHLALITNIHRLFYIDSWSCFKYFKSWIISELEICLFLKNEFPNYLDHLKLDLFHLTGKKNDKHRFHLIFLAFSTHFCYAQSGWCVACCWEWDFSLAIPPWMCPSCTQSRKPSRVRPIEYLGGTVRFVSELISRPTS